MRAATFLSSLNSFHSAKHIAAATNISATYLTICSMSLANQLGSAMGRPPPMSLDSPTLSPLISSVLCISEDSHAMNWPTQYSINSPTRSNA